MSLCSALRTASRVATLVRPCSLARQAIWRVWVTTPVSNWRSAPIGGSAPRRGYDRFRMRNRIGVSRIAAFIGIGLLVSSCVARPSVPTTSSMTAAAPRHGGTIVFAAQEPETLHPFRSTGSQTNALVYRLAVEGLTAVAPTGTPRAVLAADVPTTTNGGVRVE